MEDMMTQRALMTKEAVENVSNDAALLRLTEKCEAYKKIVEFMASDNLMDHKGISTRLAIEHPEIFLDMIGENGWEVEIRAYCRQNLDKKIQCIKKLRELTGMGLKEAKDWIETESGYF